jgi:hypothetical protein
MKMTGRTLLLIFLMAFNSFAGKRNEIDQFKLNPNLVHTVYCHETDTGVTTVMFPGVISSVNASRVAVKFDEKNPNPFLLSYTPGNYYFTIKSLGKAGVSGAINVIYNNRIYVIHLVTAKKGEGHSSITFVLPKQPKTVTNKGFDSKPTGVTPTLLLGMMDKAKGYHLFKRHYPAQVAHLGYFAANTIMEYTTHQILLKEIIRFDDSDTLFFHIQFKNLTEQEIRYNPRDLAVNVGDKILYSSISDASGKIPGKGVTSAYFAVTGTKFGGRNNLNAKNDWKVLLPVSQMPLVLPRKVKKELRPTVPSSEKILPKETKPPSPAPQKIKEQKAAETKPEDQQTLKIIDIDKSKKGN